MTEEAKIKVVSIGGGTGQSNAVRALRAAGRYDITAVVAMADDGGSTGIIRQEMGYVPGDVRKCLAALADEAEGDLVRAFEHRFSFADNHAMGNLMLASLAAETGSFGEAVKLCGKMLGCKGRVCPSTLESIVLCGLTRDGMEFRGEATLGTGPCALSKVWLSPRAPEAYPPAVQAIMDADIVVLGPGSLFTSVLPNILVPGILDAVRATRAKKVYVCSMADMQGETWGMTAEEYVDALLSHGLEGCVDAVILHKPAMSDFGLATKHFKAVVPEEDVVGYEPETFSIPTIRPVPITDDAVRRIGERIPLVIVRDFSDPDTPTWHNKGKLEAAIRGVYDSCRLLQR